MSGTEKHNESKVSIFSGFHSNTWIMYMRIISKSIDSPSNIRIMECSIAFSCRIIRKDKTLFFLGGNPASYGVAKEWGIFLPTDLKRGI